MLPGMFTFFITTFPMSSYFYEERYIFFYDSTEGVWAMPIQGFIHEALHFQFHYHWQENDESPVSKLKK